MKQFIAGLISVFMFASFASAASIPVDGDSVVSHGLGVLRDRLDDRPVGPGRRGLPVLVGYGAWSRVFARECPSADNQAKLEFLRRAEDEVRRGLSLDELLTRAFPNGGVASTRPASLVATIEGLGFAAAELDQMRTTLAMLDFTTCDDALGAGAENRLTADHELGD